MHISPCAHVIVHINVPRTSCEIIKCSDHQSAQKDSIAKFPQLMFCRAIKIDVSGGIAKRHMYRWRTGCASNGGFGVSGAVQANYTFNLFYFHQTSTMTIVRCSTFG